MTQTLTDDDVRAELRAFSADRAEALLRLFEWGRSSTGHWPAVVLRDLGLEEARVYRRVAGPRDLRENHGDD